MIKDGVFVEVIGLASLGGVEALEIVTFGGWWDRY